jgi:excisionase family DNA binding protein
MVITHQPGVWTLLINGEDYLLTGGAARILLTSHENVRRLERKGELHAVRVGGLRMFKQSEVLALHATREARKKASA